LKGILKAAIILISFSIVLLLTGCDDTGKFLDKMNLSNEQITKIRPIIEDYLKNQDKIFEVIQKYKKPSGFNDRDEMKEQREEIEGYFEGNDNIATEQVKPLVTQEQLSEFTIIAKEYRQEKFKEMFGGETDGGGPRGKGHKSAAGQSQEQ